MRLAHSAMSRAAVRIARAPVAASRDGLSRSALRRADRFSAAPRFPCGVMAAASVPPEYIALANDIVDAAGEITTKYFRTKLEIDDKNDTSPVTIADKNAEAAMRALVKDQFPEHAIFGEEHGIELGANGEQEWTWVFDPIDGTKSFITGKPLWGTLVALLHDGKPVLGILDQPVLRERWLGVDGKPSTLNGDVISTRRCGALRDAYMYATTPLMFEGENEARYARVAEAVKVPMYGCDCYAYGLLAAGHCDAVVEADLKPYDYMALVPIVVGAGGTFTDWNGDELRWQGSVDAIAEGDFQGEVCVAGDEKTHAEALAALTRQRQ